MAGGRQKILGAAVLILGALALHGCGEGNRSESPPSTTSDAPSPVSTTGSVANQSVRPELPVAAISSQAGAIDADARSASKNVGTPEWMLREIARIRAERSVDIHGSESTELSRAQHEKIIELSRQVIAETHQDPAQEQIFNNAVHYLSESRLALSLQGESEQAQLLVDDADSLYRRDPRSFAATEAASKVVQLAHRQAQRSGAREPKWFTEFANQARLFAEKFPHEPNRSAFNLLVAGQLCDLHGQSDDARSCFLVVRDRFPETVFAEQVNGFLRRMSLVGQPLQLAGPTLEGGYVSIDDYQGQVAVVVFWDSISQQFQQDCDRLAEELDRLAPQGVRVIGVNLDQDESQIDAFLGAHPLTWPQIFYSEPEKRAGRHPLARYYGIQQTPTYWLVDRTGKVSSTPEDLTALLKQLPDLVTAR